MIFGEFTRAVLEGRASATEREAVRSACIDAQRQRLPANLRQTLPLVIVILAVPLTFFLIAMAFATGNGFG
jgi:hypothetical protein